MRKRLILFMAIILVAALGISAAFTVSVVGERYFREEKEFLRSALSLFVLDRQTPLTQDTLEQAADSFGHNVRLTLIAEDGSVLADSEADAVQMENHADREEVKQALAGGTGEAQRSSETLGKTMVYEAVRTQEGLVLRMAVPVSNTAAFVGEVLPAVFIVALVVVILTIILAGRMTRSMLRPFEEMQISLKSILRGEKTALPEPAYEELKPIVDGYTMLLSRLQEYIESIRSQTVKIDNIVKYMREGLIFVDGEAVILLKNNSACRMLDIPSETAEKTKLFYVLRDKMMIDAVKKALEEKISSVIDLSRPEGRELRCYVNPVLYGAGAIMLISDVTEIKQAERMRQEFTANVSHELKTPLTSIRGFAELMSAGMVPDPETQKRYLNLIRMEADRLTRLINDVLKLSELEEAVVEDQLERVDLKAVAEQTIELINEKAKKNNIRLELQTEPCVILASDDSIRQLMINLVDNAVKYNVPGGKVRVTIRKDQPQTALIQVEDTGIGIPEEHLPRLFERFYTVDKSRSKKNGGTGLGLAIVKHVCKLYHGRIFIRSVVGKGTSIRIRFPRVEE